MKMVLEIERGFLSLPAGLRLAINDENEPISLLFSLPQQRALDAMSALEEALRSFCAKSMLKNFKFELVTPHGVKISVKDAAGNKSYAVDEEPLSLVPYQYMPVGYRDCTMGDATAQDYAVVFVENPECYKCPNQQGQIVTDLLKTNAHYIVSTLSPYVISDVHRESVYMLDGDRAHPDFETFGASVNAIQLRLFKRQQTIGNRSNAFVQSIRERMQKGESPKELLDVLQRGCGDCVEKIILSKHLIDLIENACNTLRTQ